MPRITRALDRAIALLTDGEPLDWEGLIEDAADPGERSLIEELRGLAQLDADALRVPTSSDATVGAAAPHPPITSQRWGHLELLEQIGSGAYGTVFRAWDTRLAREVALKLLAPDEGSPNLDEARRLARVSHSNVVSVYGADRVDGQIGLWMELLRGRTLDRILSEQGPFSAREAIGMGVEICGAVAAIHAAGLIHRDVKAQNVMREPGGRLVLMDVGASVSLDDQMNVRSLAGTPLYMAPELFEGAAPSVASDIYAIGVLLYRLVTAAFPVQAETIGDVRRAHAEAAQRPLREVRPDLPASFVQVVERCLLDEPAARYSSVAALERALVDASGASSRQRASGSRKFAWLAAAASVAMACTLGAALAWTYARGRALRPGIEQHLSAPGISADEYKVYSGYEELAYNKRIDDPGGAIAATNGAMSLIRSSLPGNHPIFALLYARLSESWRRAGDARQAAAASLDAATHVLESVGEDHPYTAVAAMELARNAQASGDFRRAAAEVLRALEIRWRVLGLSELAPSSRLVIGLSALERTSRNASFTEDADGDGLLDGIEAAVGLDPHSPDSNGDGVLDDDEDHDGDRVPNRLALGVGGTPFLTWAQSGAHEPRSAAWQAAAHFPMAERPSVGRGPAAWSIAATHSLSFFTQRLAPAHAVRAVAHGFSLLARFEPVAGLSSFVVDTAPTGPRFDLMVRRIDDRSIEIRLPSSIVPREGPVVVVDAPVNGPWPLLELRYRARAHSASLYVNGRLRHDGYLGHRQFQDPPEGGVSWGVAAAGDGNTRAAAAFNLVWLEIF